MPEKVPRYCPVEGESWAPAVSVSISARSSLCCGRTSQFTFPRREIQKPTQIMAAPPTNDRARGRRAESERKTRRPL